MNVLPRSASALLAGAALSFALLCSVGAAETATAIDSGQVAIDQILTRLTDAGRKKIGSAPLTPGGHELADRFLKPLATKRREVTGERRTEAEEVMKNRFVLRGMPVEDLGFPYDWFRAPRGDLQWPTGLSRHRFLVPLADLYATTGEARYAEKVVAVLLDWVAKFPINGPGLDWKGNVPGKPQSKEGWFIAYWDGPWTSLSVANRANTWLDLLPTIATASCLDNRTVAILLNSLIADHAPILIDYPRPETGNQFLTVLDSLATLGFALPDFQDAAEWKRTALDRIQQYAATQAYPDGSWAECAPNYGIGSLTKLNELRLELTERGVALPPVVTERVHQALRYFAFTSDPAGRSPRIAKGGHAIFEALQRVNQSVRDPEVAWIVSGGKEGRAPSGLNFPFNWAGHFALRTGWAAKDTWVFFEPGPRGSGHADKAQLNLELISQGDVILADPGYFSYSNVGEDNRVARYLDSARAHNTGVVDGKDQVYRPPGMEKEPNKTAGDYGWQDTGDSVSAEGAYTYGYGAKGETLVPVVHARKLSFAKKTGVVAVEDSFQGDGKEHTFDVLWQAHPTARVAVEKNAFVIVTAHARTRFEITAEGPFDVTTEVATRNPYSGWYSETLGDLQPTTTVRVTTRGTSAQLKTLITVAEIQEPK